MENNDQLIMIERYGKIYRNNRLTYQYIEHLTDPKNRYLHEPHVGFFNVMFRIYSGHLILSLVKLFDPAIMGQNENFSIEMIEKQLDISLINKEEPSIKNAIKVLKEYRNKYLVHFDLKKDRLDFPHEHELLKEAKILLEACYEAYQKLEGKEICEEISMDSVYQLNETIMKYGLFLNEINSCIFDPNQCKERKILYKKVWNDFDKWKIEKNLD